MSMQDLIAAILSRMDRCPKVKLAKLVLFVEREYYKKHFISPTGSYYVRKDMGPVPANYDTILQDGMDVLWKCSYEPICGVSNGQYSGTAHMYSAINPLEVDPSIQEVINHVVDKYSNYAGNQLSTISHNLPAWKNSERNEPLFIEELALDTEEQYYTFLDTLAELENGDDDDILEDIPPELL